MLATEMMCLPVVRSGLTITPSVYQPLFMFTVPLFSLAPNKGAGTGPELLAASQRHEEVSVGGLHP